MGLELNDLPLDAFEVATVGLVVETLKGEHGIDAGIAELFCVHCS